jgi:hypothetical protein
MTLSNLGRRCLNQYLNSFFPDFSDKHPFAFSGFLSRVALDVGGDFAATCLAPDKVKDENATFVASENR